MENKTTTKIDFAKHIFALYIGQDVVRRNKNRHKLTGINGSLLISGEDMFNMEGCSLVLKSVDNITDEHAEQVAFLAGIGVQYPETGRAKWGRLLVHEYAQKQSNVHGQLWWGVLDFLRDIGYATPWRGMTVSELIQAGVYKMATDHE